MDRSDNGLLGAKIMGIVGGTIYILSLFLDAYTGIVPFLGSISIKINQYIGTLSIVVWVIGIVGIVCSFRRYSIVLIVDGALGSLLSILVYMTILYKVREDLTYGISIDIGTYTLFIGSGLILVSGIWSLILTRQSGKRLNFFARIKPDLQKMEKLKKFIKKWGIIALKIIVPVIGATALVLLSLYIVNTVIPRSHYEKGMTAYESGNYEAAVQEFTKSKRYENSDYMLELSRISLHYQNGSAALEDGDYALANSEFLAAGNYEDAVELAHYAELGMHFAQGESLLESGAYADAIVEYSAADDFPGASDRMNEAYYDLATEQYEAGEYPASAESYSLSNGYLDSEEMIISIGNEILDNGDYASAAEVYAYSSDERYAAYAQAMELMSNGDYIDAVDGFSDAEDLFDAPERLIECRYNYGMGRLVSRDYSAATAYLRLVSGYADADTALLVASAENANESRDIVTAVNDYLQVPEDYTIEGFDVQARRAVFTSDASVQFAEVCGSYEAQSNDTSVVSQGRYGSYGGWNLTEVVPDQTLNLSCRYENGTYTLSCNVRFFVFTDYSPIRDYNGFAYERRNFTLEGLNSPISSYEFEDGTTITFNGEQANLHYHQTDNVSVSMNYVYDSQVTYVRE